MALQELHLQWYAVHLCQALAGGWQCRLHPAWWCKTCIFLGHMCQATVQVNRALVSAVKNSWAKAELSLQDQADLNCIEIPLTPPGDELPCSDGIPVLDPAQACI